MRILILANNDIGLYKFRKELIYELLKHNEVYISLPYGPLVDNFTAAGCKFIETPVDRRGMNPITDFKLFIFYRKMIKSLKPEHVITYTIKPNIYGGIATMLYSTAAYHVNVTGLGTVFQNSNFIKSVVIWLYKISLIKSKNVFFENISNRDVFLKHGIVNIEKTKVLKGAGVNLDDFPLLKYPDENTVKFLFVGRIMKEKGIDELFQAMEELISEGYKCTLDVVGSFEEGYEHKVRELGTKDWFFFHGFQEDVLQFYQACHCEVLPSWHEGMANVNLEAASCGRPIITSDIPGCREAVVDGQSGFVFKVRDKDDLKSKMKTVIKMTKAEREKMGLVGRNHMIANFEKSQVVNMTLEKIKLMK
ncbi:TPA: glycosyltransferase family 4 protein [Streptococcus suis]|nr:glycosyltransferase family 4 protein [Streptococcus suis]HEL1941732.1 glycosyltransferase family 4 protein [Streptococcus suis]HEL2123056.1 glycosyltransferase family 4 protein [Streptococcus suis]HEL2480110.1 glycosyltransferase family 4 protein [Streptococcus suis]HEM4748785.1 glycosyltransferase family 4 protein [Streptococcus suis]